MNPGRKADEFTEELGQSSWQAEARRLVRQRLAAEPGRGAALWAEVEAEAWQEVRALLKAELVAALLEELGNQEARGQGDKETPGQGDTVGGQFREAPSQFEGPPGQLSPTDRQLTEPDSQIADTSSQQPAASGQFPASSPQPPATGLYVYGVVDRTELVGLPAEGVAAGHPVTLLPYRDLAAVVSAVPLAEWGEEALKANLGNMTWLENSVRRHQAVLDAALPLAALIPMKFATVYLDASGVESFLAEHYAACVALLGELRGRQEWGLKLFGDDAILAAHIAEISPEIAQMRAEMASKPKGAAYLLARKLQEVSDREVERIEMTVGDQAHAALTQWSVAAVLNPLQGSEITGHGGRMLLNAAYLVDAAALDAFQSALIEVSAEFSAFGFQFELSGPWPAYNFAVLPADEPGNPSISSESSEV